MAIGCPDGPKDLDDGAPYADEGAFEENWLFAAPEKLGDAAAAKRAVDGWPPNGVLKKLPLPPAFWALPGGR